MTIEEARVYSAVEILGWTFEDMSVGNAGSGGTWRPEPVYVGMDVTPPGSFHYANPDAVFMYPRDWMPDDDRNQLWQVIYAMFALIEVDEEDQHPMERLERAGIDIQEAHGKSNYAFYYACLSLPAEALLAICEAHKRHNED